MNERSATDSPFITRGNATALPQKELLSRGDHAYTAIKTALLLYLKEVSHQA